MSANVMILPVEDMKQLVHEDKLQQVLAAYYLLLKSQEGNHAERKH